MVREERSVEDGYSPSYDVIACSISGRLAGLALALCTGCKQERLSQVQSSAGPGSCLAAGHRDGEAMTVLVLDSSGGDGGAGCP